MCKPSASILSLALSACLCNAALGAQAPQREQILEAVESSRAASLELYRELLTLPNDAHYPADILRLVAWLEKAFQDREFSTQRIATAGSPLLLATRDFAAASDTLLVYLQADGQPVDPSKWHQESPWQPVLKERSDSGEWATIPWERLQGEIDPEWRVFARSASDSKGPIAQFLSAIDLMDRAGLEPEYDLKIIVDTEEEMGSPNLPEALVQNRELLSADMLVIFDGPPHVSGEPTLKFGARGISTITLTTYGPRLAQHSGHYGNCVPNPALRLCEILASMKDDSGRVTIPGFYDGVDLDQETRAVLAAVPDDEASIQAKMGIATRDQVGSSLQEAVQYPIRGLSAGWVGDEVRTIIPPTATAEIDVRLVIESDAGRLHGLIRKHIADLGYHLVDGEPSEEDRRQHEKLASFRSTISYGAFRTDFESVTGQWLSRAMVRINGSEPIRIRTSGGSIPISPFVATLGIPAVGVPTVNPDNNQHSPNENLRLADFFQGIGVIFAVLTEPKL
ncbi:MAG: M20/M25/M40 family metallo-hydrolase [Planctomycetota bacterium]|jgi:acetylornithine deacetylase/succinyl-diaminopimelate desuccinylase-like protein